MTKKQLLDKLVLILESEDANNTLTFETALEQYIRSKETFCRHQLLEDTVYFSETLTIILTILHCQKSMN